MCPWLYLAMMGNLRRLAYLEKNEHMDNNLGFKMTVSATCGMTWKAFIKMKLIGKNSSILYHNYHIDITYIYIYVNYFLINICLLL